MMNKDVYNSKTNDPKVFKLGIGNDLGISYKWYGFGVKKSKVRAKIKIKINSNTAWVRTLCVCLVVIAFITALCHE